MPQLPRNIGARLIELVFKFGVSFSKQLMEARSVFDAIKVEGFAGMEDSRVLGKVSIMGVI